MDLESSTSETPPPRERLVYVAVADVKIPTAATTRLQAPAGLVDSVRTYGILQPPLARPAAGGYELVAGFKRLQAAKEAGLSEIPLRIFRVEDEDVGSLLEASNVRGGGARQTAALPPVTDYKAGGGLSGLFEEELVRNRNDIPYKSILGITAVILLLAWGGMSLGRRWRSRPERVRPDRTATTADQVITSDLPIPSDHSASDRNGPSRMSVRQWRSALADVDGIEVRDESSVPRIVFQEPVFSRLITIDPSQGERLNQVVGLIRETRPDAVLTIIGHTDDDPIRPNSPYRNNDYLGELRANEVVTFLTESGAFPSGRLRSVSSGKNEPPFSNDTAEGKARNRTVSIEIMQPSR